MPARMTLAMRHADGTAAGNRMVRSRSILCAAVLCALAGCSRDAPAPVNAGDPRRDAHAVLDDAATGASETRAAASGAAPLQQGQSMQGAIEADVGNGMQTFRSIATKVADDIGAQADKALDAGKGERALEDANRKLAQLGVETRVGKDDVRKFVGGMAGKTFHDAEVRRIDIIRLLQVTLKGTAADGGAISLGLGFDENALTLSDASLDYRPKASTLFDFYQAKGLQDVEVTIERFERNADGSYAIAGRFIARNLPASKLAKKLPASSLASASGHFRYDALPIKEMPKFGP